MERDVLSQSSDPQGNLGLPYRLLAGVGGIGSGLFFALEGNPTVYPAAYNAYCISIGAC